MKLHPHLPLLFALFAGLIFAPLQANQPTGVVVAGAFYGTTSDGGSFNCGTIFKLAPDGSLATLISFAAPDGIGPQGLILGGDGNLYGIAPGGGLSNRGTVFKSTPAGVLTTLIKFDGTNGASPNGLILGSDGNFYGTTSAGNGTVFKLTPTGTLTTLVRFTGTNGSSPHGLFQGGDGNFYGTTFQGGVSGSGTVFKTTSAGGLTTLFSFAGAWTNGAHPNSLLLHGDGNLYGTTYDNGLRPDVPSGTVFQLTPSGVLTTLHSFSGFENREDYGDESDIYGYTEGPTGLMEDGNGTIYGMMENHSYDNLSDYDGTLISSSSKSYGGVFLVTPAGGFTTLHSFAGDSVGLIPGSDGHLYGSSSGSGATIFKLTSPGVLTSLYGVGTANEQLSVQGPDGSLYGTINGLPAFKLTQAGVFTQKLPYSILHNFGDGSVPNDGTAPSMENLVQAFDGTFYGVTQAGGINSDGTIFQFTLPKTEKILYSFGRTPFSAPVKGQGLFQASDGNFYGTTNLGGTANLGTLFKMSPAGAVKILHSFGDGSVANDGANPNAGIFEAPNGNFYGTTTNGGGPRNKGVIFQLTPDGNYKLLHTFGVGTSDGAHPYGHMIQATDGNFYGTTDSGGKGGKGIVYKLTPARVYTILHHFADGSVANDGQQPQRELIQALDGNFYGTAARGGSAGLGVVFKLTPAGGLSILHSFGDGTVPQDGANPFDAGLIEGFDGNFYGTTYYGGIANGGTVYEITPSGAVSILHRFGETSTDGLHPDSSLIQGTDGNLYGLTPDGGTAGGGTLFSLLARQASSRVLAVVGPTEPTLTPGVFGNFRLLMKGVPTYWNAQEGLPPGLALNHFTGVLSGTIANDEGSYFFSLTAYGSQNSVKTDLILDVFKTNQTLTFPAIGNQVVGAVVPLQATASSGLAVTYSVSGPGQVSGSTLKVTGVGTIVVKANQAGDAYYYPADEVTLPFTSKDKTATTINFPAVADQPVGAVVTLQAMASSGLAVTYAVSGPGQVSGNKLTVTGAGTVNVKASQAGNALYAAAPTVSQRFTAKEKVASTITFPPIANQVVGAVVTLQATASSGLAVTYSISGPGRLSGSTLTVTGAGTVNVKASQEGNPFYFAATPVTVRFAAK